MSGSNDCDTDTSLAKTCLNDFASQLMESGATFDGEVEEVPILLILQADDGAGLQEIPDRVPSAFSRRYHQRRAALVVTHIDVRALRQP